MWRCSPTSPCAKEAEDRLQFLANHDPLTALPNRTHFIQRLELAVAEARNTKTNWPYCLSTWIASS